MQDHVVIVNGLSLHYREWGDEHAPPLILLHAAGCHAHWWDGIAERFADRYRVIAPDLRGHGESDRSEQGKYDFDAYASDLAGLLEALELDSIQLVGHSLGGYVGLVYASRRPSRLIRLVVADMLCEFNGSALDRVHEASTKPSPVFSSREEAEARFRLQPPETVMSAEVVAALTTQAVTQLADGRFTFKFDRRAMRHPPVCAWDVAPGVACPTLVVRGELSTLMPRAHAERLAGLLHRGTLREVRGAYHHLMLDNPQGFAAVLDEFLERTNAAIS